MSVNDKQVGGSHYKSGYQHWDFVDDVGMHYYLACASKYVTRWRSKNGLEDLEKSIHYVEKAIERKVQATRNFVNYVMEQKLAEFLNSNRITDPEADIIKHMMFSRYKYAIEGIQNLINSEKEKK